MAGGGGARYAVRIWDVDAGKETLVIPHPQLVYSLNFSPDGRRMASVCWDGKARTWEYGPGVRCMSTSWTRNPESCRWPSLQPGRGPHRGMRHPRVGVWEVGSRHRLAAWSEPSTVRSLAFSPDGAQARDGGDDQVVRVHDAVNANDLADARDYMDAAPPRIWNSTASGDGRRLAFGTQDGRLVVVDRDAKGPPLLDVKAHSARVDVVVLSHDGHLALTRSGSIPIIDKDTNAPVEVKLWEVYRKGPPRLLAGLSNNNYMPGSARTVRSWPPRTATGSWSSGRPPAGPRSPGSRAEGGQGRRVHPGR